MILQVRVVPNAKQEKIFEEGDRFKVYLTAPAEQGKANKALIRLLAKYFNVKKSQVQIIKGDKSRNKVIEIK